MTVRPEQTHSTETCGNEYGENTAYWPCSLPRAHDGPCAWHPGREKWELVARLERAETALPDVDLALAKYGLAFTTTETPDDVRAAAFEEARLALRRVRVALAGVAAERTQADG